MRLLRGPVGRDLVAEEVAPVVDVRGIVMGGRRAPLRPRLRLERQSLRLRQVRLARRGRMGRRWLQVRHRPRMIKGRHKMAMSCAVGQADPGLALCVVRR